MMMVMMVVRMSAVCAVCSVVHMIVRMTVLMGAGVGMMIMHAQCWLVRQSPVCATFSADQRGESGSTQASITVRSLSFAKLRMK